MSDPTVDTLPEGGEGAYIETAIAQLSRELFSLFGREGDDEAQILLDKDNPRADLLLAWLYSKGYFQQGPYRLPLPQEQFSYACTEDPMVLLTMMGINSLTLPRQPRYLAIVAASGSSLSVGFMAGYSRYVEPTSRLVFEQRFTISPTLSGLKSENRIDCWRAFANGQLNGWAEYGVVADKATPSPSDALQLFNMVLGSVDLRTDP